jgi:hypothetical protein
MGDITKEKPSQMPSPPPLPEPASFRDFDGKRLLVDDIDPIKVRAPHGVLIGEWASKRAYQSCETFHRRSKKATMDDEKSFTALVRPF